MTESGFPIKQTHKYVKMWKNVPFELNVHCGVIFYNNEISDTGKMSIQEYKQWIVC